MTERNPSWLPGGPPRSSSPSPPSAATSGSKSSSESASARCSAGAPLGTRNPVRYQFDGRTQPGSRSSARECPVPGPTRSISSASRRRDRTSAGWITCPTPTPAQSPLAKVGSPHREEREQRLAGGTGSIAQPPARESGTFARLYEMQPGESPAVVVVSLMP